MTPAPKKPMRVNPARGQPDILRPTWHGHAREVSEKSGLALGLYEIHDHMRLLLRNAGEFFRAAFGAVTRVARGFNRDRRYSLEGKKRATLVAAKNHHPV
jgi:hypothetical protein